MKGGDNSGAPSHKCEFHAVWPIFKFIDSFLMCRRFILPVNKILSGNAVADVSLLVELAGLL